MARIRTIKPEFWGDEKLSRLDALTRLVFIGLMSNADDAGRLIDNVKALDGVIFPNTEESCRDPLATLARLGRIRRYVTESGQGVIQLVYWSRHQRVDKPSPHVLPPEPKEFQLDLLAASGDRTSPAPVSRDIPAVVANAPVVPTAPTLDPGPETRTKEQEQLPAAMTSVLEPVAKYALRICGAANAGITQRWGEQVNPLVYGTATQLAADLATILERL